MCALGLKGDNLGSKKGWSSLRLKSRARWQSNQSIEDVRLQVDLSSFELQMHLHKMAQAAQLRSRLLLLPTEYAWAHESI